MAGVRTFSLAALAGAVAASVGGVVVIGVVLAVSGVHSALGYWRTRETSGPGITTEVALSLTVLMGALAMAHPGEAAAVAVAATILLAARTPVHHFVQSVLTEEEVRAALLLAAAVIVVLPLLPDRQLGPFYALNPRSVWRLLVLVLAIGAAGHIAVRALGPRFGLPVAGLASGFVSSAATIGAMGARAKAAPELMGAAVAGAVLSSVATIVQLALVIGATDTATLAAMAAPLVCAGVAAAIYGLAFTLSALRGGPGPDEAPGKPFSLGLAVAFAATLAVVTVASAALLQRFGEAGAIAAGAVAGLVDTHAAAISIAAMAAGGKLQASAAVIPILVAFSSNTLTKLVVAVSAGGRAFAVRVVPGLLWVAAAAWLGAWLAPG